LSKARSVLMARAATPAPPAVCPPRDLRLAWAVRPAAISPCKRSISANFNWLTTRLPISGLMWSSMRLRSPAIDDALIGRRLRPISRPASASARYQSQTAAIVSPVRTECRSADGSAPSITAASFFWARLRACSTVRTPYWPMTQRRVLASWFRYWMIKVLVPLGFARTPKPRSSLSQRKASRSGLDLSASTVRLVNLVMRFVRDLSCHSFRSCSCAPVAHALDICFPTQVQHDRGSRGEAVGGKPPEIAAYQWRLGVINKQLMLRGI